MRRCVRWLLALGLAAVARAQTSPTAPSEGFEFAVRVDSSDLRLVELARHPLDAGGSISVQLDLALPVDSASAVHGRVLLHLLVCDAAAVAALAELPPANDTDAPPYCALPRRSLAAYCASLPLEDESRRGSSAVYHVHKTVTVLAGALLPSLPSGSLEPVALFLDACETVGGDRGVLRSCLGEDDAFQDDDQGRASLTECFRCPYFQPNTSGSSSCVVSPPIKPVIAGVAELALCSSDGRCLSSDSKLLPVYYAALSSAWAVLAFVWTVHVKAASRHREVVVELQRKMRQAPLAQLAASGATCLALFGERRLSASAAAFMGNVALAAQLVALAVATEVLVLLAKGWQITRAGLPARELQWVRVVALAFAVASTVLRSSTDRHVAVVLLWAAAWATVVFLLWYSSAFNANMLRCQLAVLVSSGAQRRDLDPRRTPVFVKLQLFRRYRALLALYLLLACALGVAGLATSAADGARQWTALVGDDALALLLFVAVGYTFRCRRFRRLQLQDAAPRLDGSHGGSHGASHGASIAPAPSVDTVSHPPMPPELKKAATMVVVLNPAQERALGTAFAPEPPSSSPSSPSLPSSSPSSPSSRPGAGE